MVAPERCQDFADDVVVRIIAGRLLALLVFPELLAVGFHLTLHQIDRKEEGLTLRHDAWLNGSVHVHANAVALAHVLHFNVQIGKGRTAQQGTIRTLGIARIRNTIEEGRIVEHRKVN